MSSHHPATPVAMLSGLFRQRGMLWELAKRDFIGLYKGSMLGIVWSLFNPLLLLVIYTVVFSVAFNAKWGVGEESKVTFTFVLFSGMIIHGFFAEYLNRAPSRITSHPNYVKKVVFPLEILTWMALFSALLHFLISFGVLLVFCLLAGMTVHICVLLTPLILRPLILMIMGIQTAEVTLWIGCLGATLYVEQLTGILALCDS